MKWTLLNIKWINYGGKNENTTPYGFHSAVTAGKILFSDLKPTFDAPGDTLPKGRTKYIHPTGNVAKAEFISEGNHPYTGVFKGAKNVLVRVSVAKSYSTKDKSPKGGASNFTPGMGMKFLRDGVESANLVAMEAVYGQESWNVFKKNWSNHFEAQPTSDFALKALMLKFRYTQANASYVGLKNLSQYTEKGVSEPNRRYPFKLTFKPTSAVTSFPDNYVEDFRETLKTIPKNTTIFDVYAIDEPGCNEQRIGSIKITSSFTTSMFGDVNLFFRHGWASDDFKDYPKWEQHLDRIDWTGSTQKGKVPKKQEGCPFAHLWQ